MKKWNNPELDLLEQEYFSVLQMHALLSDTQNMIGMLGRGSGKSTHMLAPRFMRVCYDMQGSQVSLAGPTYTFVLETIVPALLTYLNQNYTRGIHFEYGQRPPNHFNAPKREVTGWKHTISTVWGTVGRFAGVDRPETSNIGQDSAHVFADELLRINETNFRERLAPSLRGNRTLFGGSPYYGGITGFSSAPNLQNDHDWWLAFEEQMDTKLINEIMYVAMRVLQEKTKLREARLKGDTLKIKRHTAFINKWEKKLRQKRKGQTTFLTGSSFTNLLILHLDYIKQQYNISGANFEKFKLSILNMRSTEVKDMFFARFTNSHIYEDSYIYDRLDHLSISPELKRNSSDLLYCDPDKAILAGWDPGDFMSIVFAQERNSVTRVFKSMYVYTPEQHEDLARKIDEFFKFHRRKTIYLYYDRAGNKRLDKYANHTKGDTDATILQKCLQDKGWHVELMNRDQRTIFHWEHYLLLSKLFSEEDKRTPRIRICQNECEELISSIRMSPVKKSEDGTITLDKKSERLDYADQAMWSTQIGTALMYLLFGRYEKFVPERELKQVDYEGL